MIGGEYVFDDPVLVCLIELPFTWICLPRPCIRQSYIQAIRCRSSSVDLTDLLETCRIDFRLPRDRRIHVLISFS